MKNVWIVADCIVSPLGCTTHENYQNILEGKSGIRKIDAGFFGNSSFYGSIISDRSGSGHLSRFETIAIEAGRTAMGTYNPDKERTIFILSTTKGNVEFLSADTNHPRLSLHATARHIAAQLEMSQSLVVSNACISGVLALITAKRMLASGKFDHALIVGAEVLSPFIVSGFQSLQALSDLPCKPFDTNRSGINLGEGAGAILLSTKPDAIKAHPVVRIAGGGLSNDANHVSGPSRTGKELAMAIGQALKSALLLPEDIDAIYAHGTATVFNDEMEAKAFVHSGMENIPLNSLKGYFGHTLGASGVIETIIASQGLLRNEVPGTKGFSEPGVSSSVKVNAKMISRKQENVLKTASGFGGCNAALILGKNEN